MKKRLKRIVRMPRNPGGIVYGTILVATLLGAESVKAETYTDTFIGIALSELVYWMALSYSEFTGERAERSESFELSEFWQEARHELAVIYGAILPLLVLIGCWIGDVPLTWGLSLGVYTAAAMIVATEIAIGLRTEKRGRDLLVNAAVGVLFGLLVIVLKLILD
jgi:hypothetical protein